MQDKKQKKIKTQIIFSILIFTVVLIADFYAMINFSKEYLLISAITVILLICLWGVLNGIFSLRALKEQRSEEQYDSVFKSEKASYLMLKKYFEEIEDKIDILQKTSKIPTEEIINAQKGIAKVVINRNRENADAIMGSNEQLMETIEEYENKIKESNDFIIESQKNVLYENLKEISEKQQSLSDSIKEMEIRLSQAITANPIQFTANVEMPKGMPVAADVSNTSMPVEPVMTAKMSEPEVIEPKVVEEPVVQPEITETPVENMPGHDIMDDISIQVPDNMEAQSVEPEPVIEPVQEETPVVEPTPAPVEEPVAEEPKAAEVPKAPEVDTSDPNRQLSPDEIAALFAGAQGGAAESSKEEPPAAEPTPAPVEEKPVAEEPKADTSDPNRQLSPDEIAALFAGAQGGAAEPSKEEPPVAEPTPAPVEEPVAEEPKAAEAPKAPGVDMSDPNRNLTPDEIAALIGNL